MSTVIRATTPFSRCVFDSLPQSVSNDTIHSSLGFARFSSSSSSKGFSGTDFSRYGGCGKCSAGRRTMPFSSGKEAGPTSQTNEEEAFPAKAVEEVADGGNDITAEGFSLLQTRRFWLGTSLGSLVALGGNLGGITSAIFNTNPDFSRNLRVDLLFPVKGFKRCLEASQGFEFVYPENWVGDQRLVYRAVERAEKERSLDLPPIRGGGSRRRSSSDPIVAFGPPGTEGEQNVSVVVAPVFPGFSLQKLGGPSEAGRLILKKFIAPEGSKLEATLLTAQQRYDGSTLYYTLEFTVKGPKFFRHNLSVYSTKNDLVFTLNAQTAETKWPQVQEQFVEIVNSFKLLTSSHFKGSVGFFNHNLISGPQRAAHDFKIRLKTDCPLGSPYDPSTPSGRKSGSRRRSIRF
ncbi:hypothetical protein R1sor_013185 [Riccia sorocarpa]|uniref:PsbP C-terminal domain-containing protein n=1 Tax=Riccia sorocarpa TaxID=122646 RepID=A0ABD3H9V4_9MARC